MPKAYICHVNNILGCGSWLRHLHLQLASDICFIFSFAVHAQPPLPCTGFFHLEWHCISRQAHVLAGPLGTTVPFIGIAASRGAWPPRFPCDQPCPPPIDLQPTRLFPWVQRHPCVLVGTGVSRVSARASGTPGAQHASFTIVSNAGCIGRAAGNIVFLINSNGLARELCYRTYQRAHLAFKRSFCDIILDNLSCSTSVLHRNCSINCH